MKKRKRLTIFINASIMVIIILVLLQPVITAEEADGKVYRCNNLNGILYLCIGESSCLGNNNGDGMSRVGPCSINCYYNGIHTGHASCIQFIGILW